MTDRCSHPHIEKMLYAYELGILDEADRRLVETHLLECNACFETARRFQQAARLIDEDNDVRKSVMVGRTGEVGGAGRTLFGRIADLVGTGNRPRLVSVSALTALVILVLVLQPWHVTVQVGRDAVAAENRIAVMHFANLADPSDSLKLEAILPNLIITDLSESRYLQVASSQRLYDLARMMGEEDATSLDQASSLSLARRAHARWMILGSVLQIEPSIGLSIQLIDVESGDIISARRMEADTGETQFDLIDRLAAHVRTQLLLPLQAGNEIDHPVADLTTSSPDAYRYFVLGEEYYSQFLLDKAEESYRQSIRHDSTFAMAYYKLVSLGYREFMEEAVRYSASASQLEQLYIMSQQALLEEDLQQAGSLLLNLVDRYPEEKSALFELGRLYQMQREYEKAAEYFHKSIAIDSLYKQAHNQLAYLYDEMGQLESALLAVDRYISIAPDEPNPYDSKGEILARNGRLEEAIESYLRVLEINPGFYSGFASFRLAQLYLFSGEYKKAEEVLSELATRGGDQIRSMARTGLGVLPMHRGRFQEALETLRSGLAEDAVDNDTPASASDRFRKHLLCANIFTLRNQPDSALSELGEAVAIRSREAGFDSLWATSAAVDLMAFAGRLDAADSIVDLIERDIEERGSGQEAYLWNRGLVAYYAEDGEKAVECLLQIVGRRPGFSRSYILARSYHMAGQTDTAISIFERIVKDGGDPDKFFCPYLATKAHFDLGRAYEDRGEIERAVEQYRVLVRLWEAADPVVEDLRLDAEDRLSRLQSLL